MTAPKSGSTAPATRTPREAAARTSKEYPGARLITMDEVAGAVVQLLHGDEHGAVVELDGSAERKVRHPNRSAEHPDQRAGEVSS